MIGHGIEFHCERRLYSGTFAFYARAGDHMATPLVMEFIDQGKQGALAKPFIEMDLESVQRLCDELWAAGIRPSQGKQSEGVNAAQDRHLQDMRAIAFAKLNVEKPGA